MTHFTIKSDAEFSLLQRGFQNSNTADLMMKRAKKMKSSARKNNFLSLGMLMLLEFYI